MTLDTLLCRLPWSDCPPPPPIYPEGAWIPPVEPVERFAGLSSAGGRPVMDAAAAMGHNDTLFHGTWSWGAGMGIALVVLAIVWTRFLRS